MTDAWQFEMFWAYSDPSIGHEVNKRRPCIIISNNAANANLGTVVVIPITKAHKPYPSRVSIDIDGVVCDAMIEQIRVLDKSRLKRKIGKLSNETARCIEEALIEYFTFEDYDG